MVDTPLAPVVTQPLDTSGGTAMVETTFTTTVLKLYAGIGQKLSCIRKLKLYCVDGEPQSIPMLDTWSQLVCQLKRTSLFNGFDNVVCGATGITVAQGGFKQPEAEFARGTPN